MVKKGILEPVSCNDGATSIVPVVKKNGSIRLFADYYSTVNPVVKQFTYLLSTVNEVLAIMKGCIIFSKLELSEVYLQLSLTNKLPER